MILANFLKRLISFFWKTSVTTVATLILADFYSAADDADKQLIHQYFLTVLAHGDITISGNVDHTCKLIRRGMDVPDSSWFPLTNLPPLQSTWGLSTGAAPMYYAMTQHLHECTIQCISSQTKCIPGSCIRKSFHQSILSSSLQMVSRSCKMHWEVGSV